MKEQIADLDQLESVLIGGQRLSYAMMGGDYISCMIPRFQQQQEILDLLLNVDYSKAIKADKATANIVIRLFFDDHNVDIRIGADERGDMMRILVLKKNQSAEEYMEAISNEKLFILPKGSINVDAIKTLADDIAKDEGDENYLAEVYPLENTSNKTTLPKLYSFYIKDLLEGSYASASSQSKDELYDVALEFNSCIYKIDLEEGWFCISHPEGNDYGKLEEQNLPLIRNIMPFDADL